MLLYMEPKKEHSEHEENGKTIERTSYDDPDTGTHAEEIKIDSTTDEQERRTRLVPRFCCL
jgi:hypothetical protein